MQEKPLFERGPGTRNGPNRVVRAPSLSQGLVFPKCQTILGILFVCPVVSPSTCCNHHGSSAHLISPSRRARKCHRHTSSRLSSISSKPGRKGRLCGKGEEEVEERYTIIVHTGRFPIVGKQEVTIVRQRPLPQSTGTGQYTIDIHKCRRRPAL
jgi:hypothetical protein